MKEKKSKDIRIRRIQILNYKGIDELEIDFLGPVMAGDSDVEVMGSRNGLGKTSVLECCTLLFIGLFSHSLGGSFIYRPNIFIDLQEMIIRAGASSAKIEGEVIVGDKTITLSIEIEKSGRVTVKSESKNQLSLQEPNAWDQKKLIDHFVSIMNGMNPNPMLFEHFLYFHSYRKVQEGHLKLGVMVDENDNNQFSSLSAPEAPVSMFKKLILLSMMSKANLFEKLDNDQSQDIQTELNKLVKHYAGGTISKLRPFSDNRVDFRIQPVDGGPTFTFDGLSSGQKEIISTLFLIWHKTRNNPSVVLIDEPELHLNPEWQINFVRQLGKIAPHNQYIIATHSEEIFGSVDIKHRFLLQSATGAKS